MHFVADFNTLVAIVLIRSRDSYKVAPSWRQSVPVVTEFILDPVFGRFQNSVACCISPIWTYYTSLEAKFQAHYNSTTHYVAWAL